MYIIYIYYICYKYRERQRADTQLAMYNDIHMFPPYPNFIHCCYITDQKSMHLAQQLKCIHQLVSCQAGKENKTGLGQGIFLLHCLFKKYISSWMQTNRIPAVSFTQFFFHSFILHPCIKLMTNKLQPLPCKVPEKFSVLCGDYLFQGCMEHSLVMIAYLRFM